MKYTIFLLGYGYIWTNIIRILVIYGYWNCELILSGDETYNVLVIIFWDSNIRGKKNFYISI